MTTASANPKMEEIRRRVASAYRAYTQLIDDQLTTLDPAKLYEPPEPTEWTIMENLAHVREIMPYWAGQIEQLLAAPGQKFGRTQKDEDRLRAIDEHRFDSLEQARAALPGSYACLEEVLEKLTDRDLALTGSHSTFGERTLDWFIDEFVTRHLEGHVEQLQRCLAALQ
jgi:uncharacterized damage-inducible protein DinB